MEVYVNYDLSKEKYVYYLNESFSNWGDLSLYNWCFERQVGAPKSDIIVVKSNNCILAGSGVSYRMLEIPTLGARMVGIMTGSWTLEQSRGKGCFTKIIEESLKLCRDRGASYLIAFVTQDNGSARRLEASGADLVKTKYFFSNTFQPSKIKYNDLIFLKYTESELRKLFDKFLTQVSDGVKFKYDFSTWVDQFIFRPAKTKTLIVNDGYVIFEIKKDVVSVLSMFCCELSELTDLFERVEAYAFYLGKRVILFSSSSQIDTVCAKRKYDSKDGYISILSTTDMRNHNNCLKYWSVNSGDKM